MSLMKYAVFYYPEDELKLPLGQRVAQNWQCMAENSQHALEQFDNEESNHGIWIENIVPITPYKGADTSFVPDHRAGMAPTMNPSSGELRVLDISHEPSRTYSFPVVQNGAGVLDSNGLLVTSKTINNPKKVAFRVNGTTHRVEDAEGNVWCLPAPGVCGCVLSWKGGIKY